MPEPYAALADLILEVLLYVDVVWYLEEALQLFIGTALFLLRRLIFSTLYYWVLRPFIIPNWLHEQFVRIGKKVQKALGKVAAEMLDTWRAAPRRQRAGMAITVFCTLSALALVAFVFRIPIIRIPFLDELRREVFTFFGRTAFFQAIASRVPPMWRRLPLRFREKVQVPYRRAWWKTMRWLVKLGHVRGKRHLVQQKRLFVLEKLIENEMGGSLDF